MGSNNILVTDNLRVSLSYNGVGLGARYYLVLGSNT